MPKCQQNLKLQLLQLYKFLQMCKKSGAATFKTLLPPVERTLGHQNVNKPLKQNINWQTSKMVFQQFWLKIPN